VTKHGVSACLARCVVSVGVGTRVRAPVVQGAHRRAVPPAGGAAHPPGISPLTPRDCFQYHPGRILDTTRHLDQDQFLAYLDAIPMWNHATHHAPDTPIERFIHDHPDAALALHAAATHHHHTLTSYLAPLSRSPRARSGARAAM
jgi:hypothetical protein